MISDKPTNTIVTISKEQLSKLPAASFKGEIHVIDKVEMIDDAVKTLREAAVIGFDTETRPSFRKGHLHVVSLLQLSTRDTCFLFRINRIGLTQSLIDLLQDPGVTKIGLSIHDDFHSLGKVSPIEPAGFIDLQHYVKEFRIIDNSLSRIYAVLFNHRISKGQRLTNWEADTLTHPQQGYAALDAQACIEIYDYLSSGQFNPDASPYLTEPPETPATSN
jgi:ribonuclease D